MTDKPLKYWYSFCFQESNATASTYIGYSENKINMHKIREAKKSAELGPNAVMISCCYLGYMTREEFTGE